MLLIVAILFLTGHCLCQNDFEDPYDCAGDPKGLPGAMVSFNTSSTIFTTDRVTFAYRHLKDGVPRLVNQRKRKKVNASYVAAFANININYRLFKADKTICSCKQKLNLCGNCNETFDQFFKFAPNVQSPQEVKSATDLDGARILFVFDKPLVMGVFSPDGRQLKPLVYFPFGKMAPSSMSNIRRNGPNSVTLLLCFDQLCGEHDIDLRNLKKPLIPDHSRPYFWSRLWLGCATDVCFDGSFDTATYVTRNKKPTMLFIRGNYMYSLERFHQDAAPPSGTLLQQMQIQRKNYDAAFRTRNEKAHHYLISDETILYSQDEFAYDKGKNFPHSLLDMNSMFSGFTGLVDAALTLDNGTLQLFQGNLVHFYSPSPSGVVICAHDRNK
ncbi:hypothetical protein HDE_13167 [Halotydeus destructor]|nr:hypothetical protein HDE_13167 [Halotydeus destructor]